VKKLKDLSREFERKEYEFFREKQDLNEKIKLLEMTRKELLSEIEKKDKDLRYLVEELKRLRKGFFSRLFGK